MRVVHLLFYQLPYNIFTGPRDRSRDMGDQYDEEATYLIPIEHSDEYDRLRENVMAFIAENNEEKVRIGII